MPGPCPRALPIIQPMVKASIRTLLDFYRVLQWSVPSVIGPTCRVGVLKDIMPTPMGISFF